MPPPPPLLIDCTAADFIRAINAFTRPSISLRGLDARVTFTSISAESPTEWLLLGFTYDATEGARQVVPGYTITAPGRILLARPSTLFHSFPRHDASPRKRISLRIIYMYD